MPSPWFWFIPHGVLVPIAAKNELLKGFISGSLRSSFIPSFAFVVVRYTSITKVWRRRLRHCCAYLFWSVRLFGRSISSTPVWYGGSVRGWFQCVPECCCLAQHVYRGACCFRCCPGRFRSVYSVWIPVCRSRSHCTRGGAVPIRLASEAERASG